MSSILRANQLISIKSTSVYCFWWDPCSENVMYRNIITTSHSIPFCYSFRTRIHCIHPNTQYNENHLLRIYQWFRSFDFCDARLECAVCEYENAMWNVIHTKSVMCVCEWNFMNNEMKFTFSYSRWNEFELTK